MSLGSTVARMRATVGLLVAVATTVLVACTLVALVPVYSTAIVDAGLRATVEGAAAPERAIQVTARAPSADHSTIVAALEHGLDDPEPFDAIVLAKSAPYRVVTPASAPDEASDTRIVTSLAAVTTLRGDDAFAAVAGDLGVLDGAGASSVSDTIPTALHRDAADLLGLAVGDDVVIAPAGGTDEPSDGSTSGTPAGAVRLTVVAIVEPADAADPRWFEAPFGRDGVVVTGSFTEIGPLFVAPTAFAASDRDATYTALFALDPNDVTSDTIDSLITTANRADATLTDALDPAPTRVQSGLGRLLRDTDTSIRSTSAVVAAILLQVAAIALYGLAVAASVLVASRGTERVLLSSRGMSTAQVARDSLAEAALIAIPAAVAGPFLAVISVDLVGRWGPLASTGLDLQARVTPIAFVVSAAAAVIAAVIVTWPAVVATRTAITGESRRTTEPFLRRTGLDIVLFVIAVLGLWQLARTGSVATSATPDGRASVDPVLVLAPTLGIVAASLLAVRLLSLAARGLATIGVRSRRLAPALAGWEAARQPARRDRTSILLVVAVAVGVFALVHAVSWQTSQRDQANATVGADIVVTPDIRPDASLGPTELPSAYSRIDGTETVAPIEQRSVSLTSRLSSVSLTALDTGRFSDYSRVRDDIIADDATIESLASSLAGPGDDLRGISLDPAGGTITATVDLAAVTTDPETGTVVPADARLHLTLVVVDEFGTFQRFTADVDVATRAGTEASGGAGRDEAAVSSPVTFAPIEASILEGRRARLVEIEALVDVPAVTIDTVDFDGDGAPDHNWWEVTGTTMTATLTDVALDGRPLDLDTATWRPIPSTAGRHTLTEADAEVTGAGNGLSMSIETGTTDGPHVRAAHRFVTFASPEGAGPPVLDALATPTLVDALGIEVGDVVAGRISGLRAQLRVVATSDVIPFAIDKPLAMAVDFADLAAAEYVTTGARAQPDRWALVTDHDAVDATTSILRGEPFVSQEVTDRWSVAEQRTRDPVLVGLAGSLLLAIAAVGVIATVGLVMSAVTGARERRAAHAVLRALGTPRRDLRRWLVRETVPLGLIAIVLGALAGWLIAALVLDSLTGDREGAAAVPPPVLVVPALAVAVLVGAALTAVVILPIATSRLLRGVRPADELRIGDQR